MLTEFFKDYHQQDYVTRKGRLLYNVWTTTDGGYMSLKGQVGEYMQTYYELVVLSEGL